MGAVAAHRTIHDTIVKAARGDAIELFHGYTYSAHPAAPPPPRSRRSTCIAREGCSNARRSKAPKFEAAAHALRGAKHVKDVRNLGMVAGVELESRDGAPGARAYEAFVKCFEAGVLVRYTGDILAFSPPLIIDEEQIAQIFKTVGDVLATVQ